MTQRRPSALVSAVSAHAKQTAAIDDAEIGVAPAKDVIGRLVDLILAELPASQILLLALAVGLLWAGSIFDWSFVTGRHAFWQVPDQNDRATALVGYWYYLRTPWGLPLFQLPSLGAPDGANLIFISAVPIAALVGKLIYGLTGAVVNPYGGYLFLCFALPGVMMALVLIAARVRCALAALVGAIFADTTPALLWRWGHMDLTAQYLILAAIALYLFSARQLRWRGLGAWWSALLVLSYLTGIYLTAMVGVIWLCALLQRYLDGGATARRSLANAAPTLALLLLAGALAGQFSAGTELPFSKGYGLFAMHLLSPVSPWHSGLIPGWSGVSAAPGGPFEGFNYLGFGLLLASLLMLPAEISWLRRSLRRHVALIVALVGFTLFAISNRVYINDRLLFELPLPAAIRYVFGIFRGSGRFFWVVTYAQMALVVVLAFRSKRPVAAFCLLGAALLQLADIAPMRQGIIDAIAAPPPRQQFDVGQVARLAARASYVEIVPSFQCLSGEEAFAQLGAANLELMLAAAKMGVPTNALYSGRRSFGMTMLDVLSAPASAAATLEARRDQSCSREIETARNSDGPGDLVFLLSDRPRQDEMARGVSCLPIGWARVCARTKR